ncbi:MAG: hypothetical protein WB819_12600, partial [Terriglobia bacterium]
SSPCCCWFHSSFTAYPPEVAPVRNPEDNVKFTRCVKIKQLFKIDCETALNNLCNYIIINAMHFYEKA